ncbi:hypothetical protein [Marispirochaeta sp.]|uniref:hypothetical protein n=1 Tax=Marispirochaeta sp. TaxID=2038653 RepID=UPI0029C85C57|nr:hypothetical protein [Marispirochaeta sp.]
MKNKTLTTINSNHARRYIAVFLFFALLTLRLLGDTSELSLGAGISLDIAPWGIEQTFFTVYSSYTPSGMPHLMARASISFNRSVVMARFPLCFRLFPAELAEEQQFEAWMGGGVELYRSRDYFALAPLLSLGGRFRFQNIFVEIPAESAIRIGQNNIDSDVGFNAGYIFNF